MSTPGLTVLAPGALTTLQDRGRLGLAHLGVPRGGPLDDRAAELANRLVGNPPEAAVLEVMLGQFVARAGGGHWVAVTGAPCPVAVDKAPAPHAEAVWVPAGSVLRLGRPAARRRGDRAAGRAAGRRAACPRHSAT